MLTDYEIISVMRYIESLPGSPEKELLQQMQTEYRGYRATGTVEDCEARKEWSSYSIDDIRKKITKFCRAIQDEHEAELKHLREKSGLSTTRRGKVGRPQKI